MVIKVATNISCLIFYCCIIFYLQQSERLVYYTNETADRLNESEFSTSAVRVDVSFTALNISYGEIFLSVNCVLS